MPRLAIKVLDQIKEPLPNNEWGIWHYYKVWNYTESLAMLGQNQDALDYLQSIPLDKYSLAIPHLIIRVQVSLGKTSRELEGFIEGISGEKMNYLTVRFNADEQKVFAEYYTAAAYEYLLAGNTATARYFAEKALSYFARIPGQKGYKYDIIDALYLSGDYQKTKIYLEKELKKNPANDELLIYLAQVEAAMGNESAALNILAKYDTLPRMYWRRNDFQYHMDYLNARIYALLGKKEHALTLLQKALDEGQLCHSWDFDRDVFLQSLSDYAPFKEMIRPIDVADATKKL